MLAKFRGHFTYANAIAIVAVGLLFLPGTAAGHTKSWATMTEATQGQASEATTQFFGYVKSPKSDCWRRTVRIFQGNPGWQEPTTWNLYETTESDGSGYWDTDITNGFWYQARVAKRVLRQTAAHQHTCKPFTHQFMYDTGH